MLKVFSHRRASKLLWIHSLSFNKASTNKRVSKYKVKLASQTFRIICNPTKEGCNRNYRRLPLRANQETNNNNPYCPH